MQITPMNNHPTPLAYFITLRAYGTWLHGDPRGSVNRTRNRYGLPGIQGNQRLHQMMQESMKGCFQTDLADFCDLFHLKFDVMNMFAEKNDWNRFLLYAFKGSRKV